MHRTILPRPRPCENFHKDVVIPLPNGPDDPTFPDHSYPSSMAARFTYSAWDGTQKGFELDADGLFDELTDDLLYHGDVNSALRRLMQQGMQDRNGERVEGLRELMDKLRQARQERLVCCSLRCAQDAQ